MGQDTGAGPWCTSQTNAPQKLDFASHANRLAFWHEPLPGLCPIAFINSGANHSWMFPDSPPCPTPPSLSRSLRARVGVCVC
jgi:hypothetical protein